VEFRTFNGPAADTVGQSTASISPKTHFN
jgi:hypothetical protein